jgi:hypothetical protein
MARKLKRTPRARATAKRKKLPKRARRPAKMKLRTKTVKRTLPDPVAGVFVVASHIDGGLTRVYLQSDDTFTIDVMKAQWFESEKAAQIAIEAGLVLATAESLFNTASVTPAKDVLKPHYSFDLVEGEYLLRADVKPIEAPDATTFAKARMLVTKALKDAEREIAAKKKAFIKTWG